MDWRYYVLAHGIDPPAEFLEHLEARGTELSTLEYPRLVAALDEFRVDCLAGRAFYPVQHF